MTYYQNYLWIGDMGKLLDEIKTDEYDAVIWENDSWAFIDNIF